MEPVGACRVSRASLSSIAPADWTRLLATNRQASAFSDRAMHDAWWIAYGADAVDESLAVDHRQSHQLARCFSQLVEKGLRHVNNARLTQVRKSN